MKNNSRLLVFIFISFIAVSADIETQKDFSWKGTFEFEDGVKVIINPKKPLYGEIVFDLEEDLSIGREDDDNSMFFRVRGIAVDNEENIYVNEYGNYRIQKFDKNGNYLLSIGKMGQGPGEFQSFMRIKIDELSGNYHILDGTRTMKIFDKEGEYINQILLEKPVAEFFLDGQGNYFAMIVTHSLPVPSKTICKINVKGKIISNYAKFPYKIFIERRGETTVTSNFRYVHDLFMSKIKADKYVYGYSGDYELIVVNNIGQIQYKIKKEEVPEGFSAREKQKYKVMKIPKHKPFFYSIFTDSKSRIYVQKNLTRGLDYTFKREVDVFSEEGYYLYKSIIPRGTYLIKYGFLYEYFINDDTGNELVKRYKIKNWDQIKVGISN